MSDKRVRVRFAPSPTGPLHMGGVRTALFNYLFAKKHGGDFILRIEDTDQTRYVPGAEDYIIESLEWCGLKFDEGVSVGGDYGPYRQSERKEMYRQYSEQLIQSGNAYYAFDTPEELTALRDKYESENKTFTYNAESRVSLRNSLTMSDEEVNNLISSGEPYVVRFKMPENEELKLNDIIRGEVVVNTSTLDDKVLFKSDGMPTYHLANVVDDYLMKISHVIRGEEWLPSMPLHVLLYRSFDWINDMPQFAHLPLILKPQGNGKLSKRDGDKLGFPVFPLFWNSPDGTTAKGYREDGYLPDAFVNMLAMLGWNPGTEQEIFTMDELIQAFSLERVGKSGSKFDPEKTKWFNQKFIQKRSDEEIAALYQPILKEKGIEKDDTFVAKVVGLVKERVSFVSELWDHSYFFFQAPKEYDPKVVKKRWKEDTPEIMTGIKEVIAGLSDYSAQTASEAVKNYINDRELGMGQVMNAFRLCIVGAGIGPDMFAICELIGQEEVVSRLEAGINNIAV